jgi:hypothetical protein
MDEVDRRHDGRIVRLKPFGANRLALNVVHTGLDASQSRSVLEDLGAGLGDDRTALAAGDQLNRPGQVLARPDARRHLRLHSVVDDLAQAIYSRERRIRQQVV